MGLNNKFQQTIIAIILMAPMTMVTQLTPLILNKKTVTVIITIQIKLMEP